MLWILCEKRWYPQQQQVVQSVILSGLRPQSYRFFWGHFQEKRPQCTPLVLDSHCFLLNVDVYDLDPPFVPINMGILPHVSSIFAYFYLTNFLGTNGASAQFYYASRSADFWSLPASIASIAQGAVDADQRAQSHHEVRTVGKSWHGIPPWHNEGFNGNINYTLATICFRCVQEWRIYNSIHGNFHGKFHGLKPWENLGCADKFSHFGDPGRSFRWKISIFNR